MLEQRNSEERSIEPKRAPNGISVKQKAARHLFYLTLLFTCQLELYICSIADLERAQLLL